MISAKVTFGKVVCFSLHFYIDGVNGIVNGLGYGAFHSLSFL